MEGLGYPAPPLLALLSRAEVQWLRPRRSAPLASLLEVEHELDTFCKPLTGEQGHGVFRLQMEPGELRINGARASLADLAKRLKGRTVVQRRVVQHPAMAALHPHSLNTMRLVTVRAGGEVRPLSFPVLRIGYGAVRWTASAPRAVFR